MKNFAKKALIILTAMTLGSNPVMAISTMFKFAINNILVKDAEAIKDLSDSYKNVMILKAKFDVLSKLRKNLSPKEATQGGEVESKEPITSDGGEAESKNIISSKEAVDALKQELIKQEKANMVALYKPLLKKIKELATKTHMTGSVKKEISNILTNKGSRSQIALYLMNAENFDAAFETATEKDKHFLQMIEEAAMILSELVDSTKLKGIIEASGATKEIDAAKNYMSEAFGDLDKKAEDTKTETVEQEEAQRPTKSA
ncbi:hypothetical protein HOD08_03315 [bacterium]|nr:hypothetical protein [bacterium]